MENESGYIVRIAKNNTTIIKIRATKDKELNGAWREGDEMAGKATSWGKGASK